MRRTKPTSQDDDTRRYHTHMSPINLWPGAGTDGVFDTGAVSPEDILKTPIRAQTAPHRTNHEGVADGEVEYVGDGGKTTHYRYSAAPLVRVAPECVV